MGWLKKELVEEYIEMIKTEEGRVLTYDEAFAEAIRFIKAVDLLVTAEEKQRI